jgi:hypothetical protein
LADPEPVVLQIEHRKNRADENPKESKKMGYVHLIGAA